MMLGEDSLDSGDQRDAYRLAVETAVEDDNRTAMGQVKSIRRMPVARSLGQASKLTELLDVEVLRQEINIDDHRVSLHDLFNRLLTDPVTGLTFQQVVPSDKKYKGILLLTRLVFTGERHIPA